MSHTTSTDALAQAAAELQRERRDAQAGSRWWIAADATQRSHYPSTRFQPIANEIRRWTERGVILLDTNGKPRSLPMTSPPVESYGGTIDVGKSRITAYATPQGIWTVRSTNQRVVERRYRSAEDTISWIADNVAQHMAKDAAGAASVRAVGGAALA